MGSSLNSRQHAQRSVLVVFRSSGQLVGSAASFPWLRQGIHENAAPREGFQTTLVGEPFALGKHAMADSNNCARIVLTTVSSPEEADQLARTLVEERLVACATLLPAVQSVYRWQGAVETATETMLLLKTAAEQLPALEARLHALHSYETPEFLVLRVEAGSRGYLDWLAAGLRQP